MDNNLLTIKNDISKLLRGKNLFDAFQKLKSLIEKSGNLSLMSEHASLFESYKYMLEYMTRGYVDPDRGAMLDRITNSIYTLTDKAIVEICSSKPTLLFYIRRNNRIADLAEALKQHQTLTDNIALCAEDTTQNLASLYEQREQFEKDIFHYVWTAFPSTSKDIELFNSVFASQNNYSSALREMLVGALLLSLLQVYDENKLVLLLNIYATHSNLGSEKSGTLALKALVCAVISMYRHKTRVELSQNVKERLNLLNDYADFHNDLNNIFINLIKAKHTDLISKELEESIIPDIMKIAPDIIDKAKKNNGVIDISSLEENPEWSKIFDSSGISKKIEQFGKLQSSGSDVFMNTFAHLKNFAFFRELYNWFRPFDYDNSVTYKTLKDAKSSIRNFIDTSIYLCDSDKYSFALSMNDIPESQRDMMMQQMELPPQELDNIEKIADPMSNKIAIVNSYIKDLYRFFKLFSRRSEFADIFKSSLNLFDIEALKPYYNNCDTIASVADIYFNARQYKEAAVYYALLFDSCDNVNPINMQKLGFAYQNQGEFKRALKLYLNYSLAKEDDLWNLKHIAACYKSLQQFDNAIMYYEKALEIAPDNIATILSIGHCHMELHQYEEAQKHYYKVNYLNENNLSGCRALAWCLLLTRDFEQSRRYYSKIMSLQKGETSDYLNFGHLCLAENKFEEALSYYYNAYTCLDRNANKFKEIWSNDIPSLIENGLVENDIPLILDSILMKLAE